MEATLILKCFSRTAVVCLLTSQGKEKLKTGYTQPRAADLVRQEEGKYALISAENMPRWTSKCPELLFPLKFHICSSEAGNLFSQLKGWLQQEDIKVPLHIMWSNQSNKHGDVIRTTETSECQFVFRNGSIAGVSKSSMLTIQTAALLQQQPSLSCT